ncbi:MAG: electron transfer flavoprotein subunit alpha/FixB family protein [Deltaproteobacteria bacterium]|nr:electron transfer flavoprotein subunit alpha/FixB family protein [Deltaproteobacteria bacterium]
MMKLFAYITHRDGTADDSAQELAAAAAQIAPGEAVTAIVTGSGEDLQTVCDQITSSFSEVIKVDSSELGYPNGELIRKVLTNLLPENAGILIAHNTFGMDLGPGLSIKLGSIFLADVVGIDKIDGDQLTVVRQEFGGQVSTHVQCSLAAGAVINIRPGSFAADENAAAGGSVTDRSGDAGDLTSGRKFLELVEAEVGDVDITKEDVLIAVGRGIEDEDNLEIVEELAEAMGAAVACSRPVVDAKWLEKSRQVGTSGLTVKPKVYLACGISGSFQHMGGIKGNPFVVAINKNPKAPIFQVADVGIVTDILDFLPELTEKIEEISS